MFDRHTSLLSFYLTMSQLFFPFRTFFEVQEAEETLDPDGGLTARFMKSLRIPAMPSRTKRAKSTVETDERPKKRQTGVTSALDAFMRRMLRVEAPEGMETVTIVQDNASSFIPGRDGKTYGPAEPKKEVVYIETNTKPKAKECCVVLPEKILPKKRAS